MQQMRRIAIISAILGALIVVDGIFQQIVKYNSGETQNVLQSNVTLTDGMTLIISGAVVLVVALIAFLLSTRASSSPSGNSPQAKR
jgi:hypothetical protein